MKDMKKIVAVSEECTKIPIHVRQPYAGELVFTAFSGSHQDAIKKGMNTVSSGTDGSWEVPYLPIDPADVGASYRETVRLNSQSGKGGVAFVLEHYFGVTLPRALLMEFSSFVQEMSEEGGGELKPDEIWNAFSEEYVNNMGPYELLDYDISASESGTEIFNGKIKVSENEISINGCGSGPIAAFVDALVKTLNEPLNVVDYHEYALNKGSQAQAICIMALEDENKVCSYGVGTSQNTNRAAFDSILSSLNRKWSK